MTTESTVRTTSGAVRGTTRDGVYGFLGIPYAAPPFGPRRFAAPQPAGPWDGVRAATEYGPTAPKPPYAPPYDVLLPEPQIPGEDCLNLNVWTPDPGGTGLPVFVWIPGGAFVNGSGAVPVYDGATFARDGVVCVTINYRLGVDGFLQFPDGGPANRGLLDQVAALRWVQDNIAAFGGDPGRVTVGGESAGAMSIGCLLAMPSAEGLFTRAVLQSGAGHHALTAATATRIGGYLAERLNLPPERAALAGVPLPDLIAAQQAIAQEPFQAPNPARWGEVAVNLMAFEPVIDGEVLPDLPIRRIAAGSARDIAVLVGANRDEHRLFLVPNGIIDMVSDQLL
jgi:para-nitrobenzyl esterase